MSNQRIILRELSRDDFSCFLKWWRDKELIKLTSGVLKPISDTKAREYFDAMLNDKKAYHFMVVLQNENKIIGHLSLSPRSNNWHETQIIIGEKEYWGKGYGTEAIKLLLNKAKEFNINKIFLEVRPENKRAIKAYGKCGFVKSGIKKYPKNKYLPETIKMILR